LLNPDFNTPGDYYHYIAQSATSLPDDEEASTDIKDYISPTWASFTKDAFDTIAESCPAG
jgi:hypothetical protein